MKLEHDLLFKAIRYGFNQTKIDFDISDEIWFTKTIFENGLIGLIYESIDFNTFKNDKMKDILSKAFKEYQIKDFRQIFRRDEVKSLMNEAGIDHIFLKGTHLKTLYPKTYMRAMGDIDFIVRPEDFKKAQEILIKHGYTLTSKTTHHHVFHTPEDVVVELHIQLLSQLDESDLSVFNNPWAYAHKQDKHTYVFEKTYEYMYLFKHLARHTTSSGIGIRSIIDLGLFLRKYQKDINQEHLLKYVKNEQLLVFYEKMNLINDVIFDRKAVLEEGFDETISYIIKSGIHGSGSEFNSYMPRAVHHHGKKSKWIFGTVFPSLHIMKARYEWLGKLPFLLPIAWLFRIISFIFRPTAYKRRMSALKDKELVEKTKEVHQYLGL